MNNNKHLIVHHIDDDIVYVRSNHTIHNNRLYEHLNSKLHYLIVNIQYDDKQDSGLIGLRMQTTYHIHPGDILLLNEE